MSQAFAVRVDQYAWTKEFKKLEKAFKDLQKESTRDARKVLLQQARLFCIDLMFITNPYGKSTKTKKVLEKAIKQDIKRVYITAADIYDKLNFQSKEQGAAFYALMKRGRKQDLLRAEGILRSLQITIDTQQFDGGQYHKSKRDRRGRVPKSTEPRIIADKRQLDKYRREVVKRVGFAKGGFADAALTLARYPENNGNTRGIPAWTKRHAVSNDIGGANVQSRQGQETVIIINKVRYIKNLVGKAQILSAMRSRARSMSRLARKVIEINAQNKIRKKLMTGMTAGL